MLTPLRLDTDRVLCISGAMVGLISFMKNPLKSCTSSTHSACQMLESGLVAAKERKGRNGGLPWMESKVRAGQESQESQVKLVCCLTGLQE
jgi:hypothetical protein